MCCALLFEDIFGLSIWEVEQNLWALEVKRVTRRFCQFSNWIRAMHRKIHCHAISISRTVSGTQWKLSCVLACHGSGGASGHSTCPGVSWSGSVAFARWSWSAAEHARQGLVTVACPDHHNWHGSWRWHTRRRRADGPRSPTCQNMAQFWLSWQPVGLLRNVTHRVAVLACILPFSGIDSSPITWWLGKQMVTLIDSILIPLDLGTIVHGHALKTNKHDSFGSRRHQNVINQSRWPANCTCFHGHYVMRN